ncbi:MAG: hypothetical protein AB1453_10360 [Chloroflexota bacterium]
MRIKYTGGATRIIGYLCWDAGNDHVENVPGSLAGEVLSQPGETFAIAADEPLRKLNKISEEELIELALNGIGSLAELALLDPDAIKTIHPRRLAAWINQARRAGNHDLEE